MIMKKLYFGLSIILAVGLYSCTEDGAFTENPIYDDTATGENPKLPNGGGNTGGGTGGGGGTPTTGPTLVDTAASNRVAVLEDFTGVRCVFCPFGHQIAASIEQQYGDRFITIATHGGSFAQPGNVRVVIAAGDTVDMYFADFTTPFAQPLITQSNLTGYPAGTMNRLDATVLGTTPQNSGSGGSAMSRGQWANAAAAVIGMTSPVNVGAEATISGNMLTVKTEVYYTDEETDDNSLYVALIQDGIESIQIAPGGLDTAYIQDHTLRHYLTGQWGDESNLTGTKAKGYFDSKTYVYEIPAEFHASSPNNASKQEGIPVIEDMKVVVFVARGRTDILNATEVPIN